MQSRAETFLIVGMCCLAASWSAGAQPNFAGAVRERVDAFRTERNVPGISVAVIADGKFQWADGVGLADIENEIPASAETAYRIASISKMITAAGVMILIEEGTLDLDDAASAHCPTWPEKQWPITIHHLLCHQSGIRHWKAGPELENTERFRRLRYSLMPFKDDDLLFEPGTGNEYSTPAYNVLGCIIENASGQTFIEYMDERVFTPAGMTTMRDDDVFALIPHRAAGYQMYRGELARAPLHDVSIKIPGGGLIGSVVDVARFAEAMLNDQLVSRDAQRLMWSNKSMNSGEETHHGYGCSVGEEKGRKVVWHIGGVAKASSVLYIAPEQDAAVALLCNLQGIALFPLASEIVDLLTG